MITRDNYEEYFLLYGDNELSPAERLSVEEFVTSNPDLREEWELLMNCKLDAEPSIGFGDKSSLLKMTGDTDDAANYQEYLLSYIDNELDAAGRAEVEAGLVQHPGRVLELAALRRAVLEPDNTIVFGDKSVLYRKEEKRIIWLPLLRMTAAAVTLAVTAWLVFKTHGSNENMAFHHEKIISPAGVTPGHADTLHFQTAKGNRDANDSSVAVNKGSEQVAKVPGGGQVGNSGAGSMAGGSPTKVSKSQGSGSASSTIDHRKEETGSVDAASDGGQDLATTGTPPRKNTDATAIASVSHTPAAIGTQAPDPGHKADPIKLVAMSSNTEARPDAEHGFATHALLADAGDGSDAQDNENGLNTDDTSPKKSKFRGLFRKVSRVLEKRASRDDDEKHNVSFGGFALK